MLSINPFPTIYQPFTIMKVRTIHTAVVFLLSLISSSLCLYAQNDILIDQPLTWSIDSVQVSWTVPQATESVYLYQSEPEYNPLSLFGFYGKDVTAFVYEGGFNYNQTDPKANPTQWSETEKEVVSQALTVAFESYDQKTTSNQRLVFTVKFVNHTNSHFKIDYRYTNYIPVYIGETEIGKAAPVGIDKVVISIPPTGEPVSVKFAMPIDEKCKSALLNYKPILKFSEGKLLFRTPDDDIQFERSIYKKSVTNKDHFTVAIQADREVKEWKINWVAQNPVTLQEALEAINDNIRRENLNDAITVFDIKDNHIVTVCGSPFTDKDAPDWITELKVFKDGAFQMIADPDSCLSQTPRSGERYVFQLVNQEFKKLVAKANAGDAAALNELGDRYFDGDGVAEDIVKAVELYRKSAEKGYAEGQYNLGLRYFNGEGVPEDSAEAAKWFQKAAEQGNADAQICLCYCYLNGLGVTENKAKGIEWLQKAVQQGNARVQYNLGWCYFNGEGVAEDKVEAVKWFRKAAESDYADAQYNLGCSCYNGVGVEEDKVEGLKWIRKAADQGYEDAIKMLKALKESDK